MTGPVPTSVAWDDPRVVASPIPAITRDYLMAVARLKVGLPARGSGPRKVTDDAALALPPDQASHRLIVGCYLAVASIDGQRRWHFDAEWHAEVYRAAQIVGALLAAVNPGWWASWS